MIAGVVKSYQWGHTMELTVVFSMEGDVKEFPVGTRVMLAVIPDDREMAKAYERGKHDGIEQERWWLKEQLDRRDGY